MSLTLRKGHKLQVFENRVIRKIFETIKDEISEQFRILYAEELCHLGTTSNIVKTVKSKRM
jgi:hypothetical protein